MTELIARVDGAITLLNPPAKVIEKIRRELSFPNPEYIRALRMDRPTHGIIERIYCASEVPDGIMVPRGAMQVVRKYATESGFSVRVIDKRVPGDDIEVPRTPQGLRDYQIAGARDAAMFQQGTIILPCGGGKTVLGIAAIAMVKTTTLVIVPTEELLGQWVEAMRQITGIEAGTMSRGQLRPAPVVIAIVNSLKIALDTFPALGKIFGFVICDECHRAPSNLFQNVLMRLPAKRRLGLTATPEREDGLTKLIEWSFGRRLLERSSEELISAGYLTVAEVHAVKTLFEFSYVGPEKKRMDALTRSLVADERRNWIICALAKGASVAGNTILVLSNRKNHLKILDGMLTAAGSKSHAVVTSGLSSAKRKAIFDQFKEGKLSIILATSLADEGLDVARLSRIILALPERAKGRTIQRVGRLMRNFPGKRPILYDLVDFKCDTLKRRWEDRRRAYRSLQLPIREIPSEDAQAASGNA